jgi:hypothetical protein
LGFGLGTTLKFLTGLGLELELETCESFGEAFFLAEEFGVFLAFSSNFGILTTLTTLT